MNDFFASLYEWFGLISLYSKDLGDHLRGFDITCSEYIGKQLYVYVGWIMIIITIAFYILQYYIVNSTRFNKKWHWWIMALSIAGLNFLIAFGMPFADLQAGDYCNQLRIATSDCIGFGISNALWSFILFLLITSFPYPRKWAGHNVTNTTFWKP